MQFKRVKRNIDGVLLLDKAKDISSNGALQQVKRLYQAAKAGHTGNLDPIATGLLPICLGEATKFSQFLLDADKTYEAVFQLGETTTTGDSEGELIERKPVKVTERDVKKALERFTGSIMQTPPMYSALKHQGKALYTYARAGVESEREPREVTMYRLELEKFENEELVVTVACSKGTYIRVLAEDIGAFLGCGAHMKELRRTQVGPFQIAQSVTADQLENMTMPELDGLLLSADCLLEDLQSVNLDADSAYYIRRGQPVWQAKLTARGLVRVYDDQHILIGVGEVMPDGKIAPKRLVVQG